MERVEKAAPLEEEHLFKRIEAYSKQDKILDLRHLLACHDVAALQHPVTESTPLHYACQYGAVECIKWLIKRKVKLNSLDKNGLTPLFYLGLKLNEVHNLPLTYRGRLRTLLPRFKDATSKLLTEATNRLNNDFSPLRYSYQDLLFCVGLLLEKGANPSLMNKQNLSFMNFSHLPSVAEMLRKWEENLPAMVFKECLLWDHLEPLIDYIKDHDINTAYFPDDRTLLHLTCQAGAGHITFWLLQQGANVRTVDRFGNTPLHYLANSLLRSYTRLVMMDMSNYRFTLRTELYVNMEEMELYETLKKQNLKDWEEEKNKEVRKFTLLLACAKEIILKGGNPFQLGGERVASFAHINRHIPAVLNMLIECDKQKNEVIHRLGVSASRSDSLLAEKESERDKVTPSTTGSPLIPRRHTKHAEQVRSVKTETNLAHYPF